MILYARSPVFKIFKSYLMKFPIEGSSNLAVCVFFILGRKTFCTTEISVFIRFLLSTFLSFLKISLIFFLVSSFFEYLHFSFFFPFKMCCISVDNSSSSLSSLPESYSSPSYVSIYFIFMVEIIWLSSMSFF